MIELILDALEDFTLRILLVASIVSIAISVGTAHDNEERSHAWVEGKIKKINIIIKKQIFIGFAIFIAVFVCASVTAVNDYQKER